MTIGLSEMPCSSRCRASLGQLGSLKQLTLAWLGGLEVLPDAVVRLTSLGSLTIGMLWQAQGAAEGNRQAGGAEGAHASVVG